MTAPRPFAEIVEELTRLDAAATPGPWEVTGFDEGHECTDERHSTVDRWCINAKWDSFGPLVAEAMALIPFMDRPVLDSKEGSRPNADLIAAMRNALPFFLSRLASREAVFEAAVAWRKAKRSYGPEAIALEVAIDHARALDAATPQGEEG